jgi:glucose-6-phosphate dehydrogenase assembly protein OpcA
MYAQKNVDAYAADVTLRREGRVTTTGSRVVSKDGRTMTIMLSTTNPQGQMVTTVRVFDRQ